MNGTILRITFVHPLLLSEPTVFTNLQETRYSHCLKELVENQFMSKADQLRFDGRGTVYFNNEKIEYI